MITRAIYAIKNMPISVLIQLHFFHPPLTSTIVNQSNMIQELTTLRINHIQVHLYTLWFTLIYFKLLFLGLYCYRYKITIQSQL